MSKADELDQLLEDADSQPFTGWDFSWIESRVELPSFAWNYEEIVRSCLAAPVLDMGTGGGEVFSTISPFPGLAVATESWPPNVRVAHSRLRPLGASVVQVEGAPDNIDWLGTGGELPFQDATFPLVVNRHESFSPTEVLRILRPGGAFVTQQVGERNDEELCQLFGTPQGPVGWPVDWGLRGWTEHLRSAGFDVVDAREELQPKVFRDVGAIVWYMKALAWKFPSFDIRGYRSTLAQLHDDIRRQGGFPAQEHRYLVDARCP